MIGRKNVSLWRRVTNILVLAFCASSLIAEVFHNFYDLYTKKNAAYTQRRYKFQIPKFTHMNKGVYFQKNHFCFIRYMIIYVFGKYIAGVLKVFL